MTQPPSPVVVLIGLRGAGKTTLGRALAEASGRSFEDLDDRALASCPEASIREVFDRRGEPAWRESEANALQGALEEDALVLALGGGAPMVESIQERLEEARATARARVIWLDAPDEVLAQRIGPHGAARPPLLHEASGEAVGPLEECRRLRQDRAPTYERLADAVLDTDGDPEQVVQRLHQATLLDRPGPSSA